MAHLAAMIGVVRGASNRKVQDIFRSLTRIFAGASFVWSGRGGKSRLAGSALSGGICRILHPRTGSIFEDGGPGAAECYLDGAGAVTAAASV